MKVFLWIHFSLNMYLFQCVQIFELRACNRIHQKLASFLRKIQTYGNSLTVLRTRMRNFEINLLKSTLMQIRKSSPIYSNSYKHNSLKIFHSLSQEFSSYLPVKFVYFVKSRLFFNISRISKIQNAKFFEYCFYMNTNIQGNFQIRISVPLMF